MKLKITMQRANLTLLALAAFCATGLFVARMDSAKAEFNGPCPDEWDVYSPGATCEAPNTIFIDPNFWGVTCAMGASGSGEPLPPGQSDLVLDQCCKYRAYDIRCQPIIGQGPVIGVHQVLYSVEQDKRCFDRGQYLDSVCEYVDYV